VRRWPWPLLIVLAAGIARAQAPSPAPDADDDTRFSHVQHAGRKGARVEQCARCHGLSADFKPLTPGADGHQPCMTSGCHLDDFLDEKTTLCLGCHASTDNFRKNPARDVYGQDPSPEHVVEIDHKAHMERGQPGRPDARATCQTCHWVDRSTFVAVTRPGHAQCAPCHGQSSARPMSGCATCHLDHAPAAYFTKKRHDPELNGKFLHERVEHRFYDKDARQKPMQCDTCHAKVTRHEKLQTLRAAALVDSSTMKNNCAKCHDVRDTGKCLDCHRPGTIVKTFNYHTL
jgi:hypothetical protein